MQELVYIWLTRSERYLLEPKSFCCSAVPAVVHNQLGRCVYNDCTAPTIFALFAWILQLHFYNCIQHVTIPQHFNLAIGNLRLIAIIKPPIINAHAHNNPRVHQIAKLKHCQLHFYEKIAKIKCCQYKVLYSRLQPLIQCLDFFPKSTCQFWLFLFISTVTF